MSDWIPRLMAEKVQLEQQIVILGTENLQLKAEIERLASHINKMITERDTLHAQLDEARELLKLASYGAAGGDTIERIDDWLERSGE